MPYIFVAGASQGFLLSFVLFTRPDNHRANKFLAAIIFWISTLLIFRLFWFIPNYTLIVISGPLFFSSIGLPGPLLFLYVKSMCGEKVSFKKEIKHFLPSILLFIFLALHMILTFREIESFDDLRTTMPGFFFLMVNIFVVVASIGNLAFGILSWKKIQKYSSVIKEYVSDIERVSLKWVKIFIILLLIIFGLFVIVFNARFFLEKPHEGAIPLHGIFMSLFQLAVIIITAYNALRQPDIFRYIGKIEESIDKSEEKEKYLKQSITDEQLKNYSQTLEEFMSVKRPHLDESLSLKELAEKINIPMHHLTITLNKEMNQNFYTYINAYRINEVKYILSQPEGFNISILDAAYDSGFKSKSTFNKVFKELTGETPTEYKRRVLLAG